MVSAAVTKAIANQRTGANQRFETIERAVEGIMPARRCTRDATLDRAQARER